VTLLGDTAGVLALAGALAALEEEQGA